MLGNRNFTSTEVIGCFERQLCRPGTDSDVLCFEGAAKYEVPQHLSMKNAIVHTSDGKLW